MLVAIVAGTEAHRAGQRAAQRAAGRLRASSAVSSSRARGRPRGVIVRTVINGLDLRRRRRRTPTTDLGASKGTRTGPTRSSVMTLVACEADQVETGADMPAANSVARPSQSRLQLLAFRQARVQPAGPRCPSRKCRSAISRRLNYLLVGSLISCWAGAPAIRGRNRHFAVFTPSPSGKALRAL